MKTMFTRFVCRVLVASMVILPLQAQADLIGTGEVLPVNRAAVAEQLQSLGLTPQIAQERVAALTDAEIVTLTNRLEQLPAGAGGQAIGFLIVAIFLWWRFVYSDQAQAEASPAKPAAKPAAKPKPEAK